MKTLVDTRPYIKTAIPSSNNKHVTILRLNQTTDEVYSIVIPYDVWVSFRKNRDIKILKDAGLSKIEIEFMDNNNLPGEIKEPIKPKSKRGR